MIPSSRRAASVRLVQSWILSALGVSACHAAETAAPTTKAPEPFAVRIAPTATNVHGTEPPPRKKVLLALEADGRRHRPEGESCSDSPDPRCGPQATGCHSDAECTAPGTACRAFGESYCACTSTCAADSDCGANQICNCSTDERAAFHYGSVDQEGRGACMNAGCHTDADCAPGPANPHLTGECLLVVRDVGCSTAATFVCGSDKDSCKSDRDCTGGMKCMPGANGLECDEESQCMEGRPLYVDDVPQTADLRSISGGWSRRYTFSSVSPDDDLGAAAGRAAAEEHASIGAFARTIVELIALGAPPELLRETQEALADEIRHAELAFALARAAGSPREPGLFPAATAPFSSPDTLAADLARSVLRGGCFGETEAAIRLLERAFAVKSAPSSGAATEELTAFYTDLSRDEARHAALAFRTIGWLLKAFPREVAPVVAGVTVPTAVASIVAPILAALLSDSVGAAEGAPVAETGKEKIADAPLRA